MPDVGAALRKLVGNHLRRRGLAVDDAPDALTIGIGEATLALVVAVHMRVPKKDSVVIEVEFRVKLWPPQFGEVTQYQTGWAADDVEALAEAVHGWIDGVWPVLEALYRPETTPELPAPIEISTVTGTNQPVSWRILVGPPMARCHTDVLAAVQAQLSSSPPFSLMVQAFADAVNQRRLLPDGTPYWGHLFASQLDRQPGEHEAMLRTDPWPEAVEGLLEFRWPASDLFMSFRQFYVIKALKTKPEPGRRQR